MFKNIYQQYVKTFNVYQPFSTHKKYAEDNFENL